MVVNERDFVLGSNHMFLYGQDNPVLVVNGDTQQWVCLRLQRDLYTTIHDEAREKLLKGIQFHDSVRIV